MDDDWWDSSPDPGLSQGDIITDVPVSVVFFPLTPLAQQKGAEDWRPQSAWTPNREGVGNVLARGRVGAVLVLSHECELDKPGVNRVAVAPIGSLDAVQEPHRTNILAQENYSKMPLPAAPVLGNSYADLRLTTTVDRAFLDVKKRVASLSEKGIGRLRLQIIAHYTRADARSLLEALSKKSK